MWEGVKGWRERRKSRRERRRYGEEGGKPGGREVGSGIFGVISYLEQMPWSLFHPAFCAASTAGQC